MAEHLIPIAISSELDVTGEERIHVANKVDGYTEEERPYYVAIVGDLGDGYTGSPVDYTYTVIGAVAPYVVTLVGGTLVAGTTMDTLGHITGVRTTVGTYNWTVRVTDVNGKTDDLDDTSITGIAPPTLSFPSFTYYGPVGTMTSGTPITLIYNSTLAVTSDRGLVLASRSLTNDLAISDFNPVTGLYSFATITGFIPDMTTGNAVQKIAISADGEWVYSISSDDSKIYVLQRTGPGAYTTVTEFNTDFGLTGQILGISAIVLSPDETRLAVVANEGVHKVSTYAIDESGGLTFEATSSVGAADNASCYRLDWVGRYIVHEDYNPLGVMRILDADNDLAVVASLTGAQERLIGFSADGSYLYTVGNLTPYNLRAYQFDGSSLVGVTTLATNEAPTHGSRLSMSRIYLSYTGASDCYVYSVDGADFSLEQTIAASGADGAWLNPELT